MAIVTSKLLKRFLNKLAWWRSLGHVVAQVETVVLSCVGSKSRIAIVPCTRRVFSQVQSEFRARMGVRCGESSDGQALRRVKRARAGPI